MVKRNFLTGGISGSALALALVGGFGPTAAAAQDAAETVASEAEGEAEGEGKNVITVSGFRASLQSAVNEKKSSDQILESISAEDIGKLPDNSIGESIARLPGVAAQRLNGRANVIAIRGLGPDFSQTLLNGREQTSTGDNRGVEFDQYASEIVNQVVVYKSPIASLVGQGLAGTVDVRTVRPLEAGKRVIAIGARGAYAGIGNLNAGSDEAGYRVNAAYIDQFADDTIGISLAASYTDEPYQVEEFNAWGYAGANVGGQDAALIGGNKSFVTSTQLKRFGLTGTVQWEPSPNWMVTADAFYSDFEDDQIKRGIELPLGFGAFGTTFDPATATVTDGTVTSGTFENVQGVVRNDVFERNAELFSGGLNVAYTGDDGWTAELDFGYSRTDRNELSLESYSGTGYNVGNGAVDTIGFTTSNSGTIFSPTLDYSDTGLIRLTDPLGWGGATPQAGFSNNRIVDDELKQYRVQISKDINDFFLSRITLGMNYTDRDKSLTPDENFVRLAGGLTEVALPQEFLLRPTDLSFLGLGPVVSYDPRDIIAAGNIYFLEPNVSNDVIAKAFRVSEDLMTLYAKADINQSFANSTLTGNVGVQAVHTDQKSTGLGFLDGVQTPLNAGASYWDILPSLNLSLRFDSDYVIRFAASRQIQRPRLDDMRVAIGLGISNNAADSPTGLQPFLAGGGGNPNLRPFRANAVDLNFEKYFGTAGVLALQLFYKDIVNYIDNGRAPFDFTGFPIPVGQTIATTIGTLDAPQNTDGGNFYGGEFAFTLPFGEVVSVPVLSDFGLTGGVSYTESKVKDFNGNTDQIPGFSKWVANTTLFYETGGFSARGSARYRSSFLGDFTGFGGSPVRRIAIKELIVDAQIGYDFEDGPLDGLSVYLQGQNLTDEPFVSINGTGNRDQVVDHQRFGRRYLAGFTYRF